MKRQLASLFQISIFIKLCWTISTAKRTHTHTQITIKLKQWNYWISKKLKMFFFFCFFLPFEWFTIEFLLFSFTLNRFVCSNLSETNHFKLKSVNKMRLWNNRTNDIHSRTTNNVLNAASHTIPKWENAHQYTSVARLWLCLCCCSHSRARLFSLSLSTTLVAR